VAKVIRFTVADRVPSGEKIVREHYVMEDTNGVNDDYVVWVPLARWEEFQKAVAEFKPEPAREEETESPEPYDGPPYRPDARWAGEDQTPADQTVTVCHHCAGEGTSDRPLRIWSGYYYHDNCWKRANR
jgi:hypothetical protein